MLRQGIDPRDIIIGGDSNAGAFAILLLRHLHSPIPGIEPISLDSRRLAGAFLVSPWVGAPTDAASYRDNAPVDILTLSTMKKTAVRYFGPGGDRARRAAGHPVLPMDGDLGWLRGIQDLTSSMYITCGYQEIMRDDILAFSEAIRLRNPDLDLRVEVAARAVHDSLAFEGVYGFVLGCVGGATRRMRRWALTRFGSRGLS